jgi:hypothetical protein
MYGQPAEVGGLPWSWVDAQLGEAPAYWVVTPADRPPRPRPVWGVWLDTKLHLSIGSPALSAGLGEAVPVTVHLGSVTDVVIVEGWCVGPVDDQRILGPYDDKYDWSYEVDRYGPLTTIAPVKVMAWRSAGWAGREGFQQTGRWRFPPGG